MLLGSNNEYIFRQWLADMFGQYEHIEQMIQVDISYPIIYDELDFLLKL